MNRRILDGRRRCARCEIVLDVSAFPSSSIAADGLSSWCKGCHLKRTQQWRRENPAYIARYNARRRQLYATKTSRSLVK